MKLEGSLCPFMKLDGTLFASIGAFVGDLKNSYL